MKKLKKISFEKMFHELFVLGNDEQGKTTGGSYGGGGRYTESQAIEMMHAGTWRGGYVEGYGYVSASAFVFGHDGRMGSVDYYGSGATYTQSLKISVSDFLVRELFPPFFNLAIKDVEDLQLDCISALQNLNYNGPIYVEIISSPSYQSTDLSTKMIIYSGQTGNVLFDTSSGYGSGAYPQNGSSY